MIKVRIWGLKAECEEFTKYLKKMNDHEVLKVSEPFKDRGDSKFHRVYVEMQKKGK